MLSGPGIIKFGEGEIRTVGFEYMFLFLMFKGSIILNDGLMESRLIVMCLFLKVA